MRAKIVSIRRTFSDQLYLPEIARGLVITLKHFFVNLFTSRQIETLRYGEWDTPQPRVVPSDPDDWRGKQKMRVLPERYRGRHRLMKRDDGTVRCTACMMCATICPANCIHIEAGERENPQSRSIEKFPLVFEIDELICVVCGLCVEACPCDALRMDSQVHVAPVERRADAVLDKPQLMQLGTLSIARDGGAGDSWREQYRAIADERQIYRPDGQYPDANWGYRKRATEKDGAD